MFYQVAPRAGAWIETSASISSSNALMWSHPVRVRGFNLTMSNVELKITLQSVELQIDFGGFVFS